MGTASRGSRQLMAGSRHCCRVLCIALLCALFFAAVDGSVNASDAVTSQRCVQAKTLKARRVVQGDLVAHVFSHVWAVAFVPEGSVQHREAE